MRIFAVASFFIAVICAGSAAIGCGGSMGTEPGSATLTGAVNDAATNLPIAGASVTITGSGFAPYTLTTTDIGKYAGVGIPLGPVTVSVKASGYVDVTKQTTLTSGTNILDFLMNRTP